MSASLYDVFLSHNSLDKQHVSALADWLGKHKVSCFLDAKDLEPGDVLSDALGKAMEASKSAIICIGPHGEGPWHKEEMDTLLNRSIKVSRTKDEFRIIPVLLPGADTTKLRWFLETRLWVDLQKGITDSTAELERLKSAILGQRGHPVQDDPGFNPYRGLESFQASDARFFFGRDQESADLAQKLKDWRFAAIVGPSGNGKSSLARAGLATDPALAVLPDLPTWHRLIARPGRDLLRSILSQLYATLSDETRSATVSAALARILPPGTTSTPQSWASGLDQEFSSFYSAENSKVLLLIDQFEEVFTHRGTTATTDSERQTQLQFLLDALAHFQALGGKRWHIVLTMRSDFYQRCRISVPFWALLEKQHLRIDLDELNEQGWREAIKGPAARSGAYLEAGLVEIMLKDVYRQRGSMPLLQLALQELWRLRDGACLTHAAYTTIGGVANALQRRAETCLANLNTADPECFEIARQLFIRLTAPGEGVSDTRRRTDRSELNWENTDPAKLDQVIDALSDADNRLIVTDGEAVEVTHEVLIRDCATIRGWIESVRSEIPMLRRLSHAARRWQDSKKDPIFLSPADPPRELKLWIQKTTLRLTPLEREFWQASRKSRSQQHADKRSTQRQIREEQQRFAEEQELRIQEAEAAKSRAEKATRIIRTWTRFAAAFAVTMFLAAGCAVYFLWRTSQSEKVTQRTLSKAFMRIIGQNGEVALSSAEHDTLWELAELTEDNEAVRMAMAQNWLGQPDGPMPALIRDQAGLRALTGLRPERLDLDILADDIVTAIENKSETDDNRISSLEASLPVLVASRDATKLVTFAGRLIHVLKKEAESKKPPNEPALALLVEALKSLAARLDATTAAPVVKQVMEALDHAWELDVYSNPDLLEVLKSLAARLDAKTAAPFVAEVVNALADTEEPAHIRNRCRVEVLKPLVAKLDAETSAPLIEQAMGVLEKEDLTQILLKSSLAKALEMMVAKADTSTAASWLGRLMTMFEKGGASERIFSLPPVQIALIAKLDARAAPDFAKRVVTMLDHELEMKSTIRFSRMAEVLNALSAKFPVTSNPDVAERVLKKLEAETAADFERIQSLLAALNALVVALDAETVGGIVKRVLTVWEARRQSFDYHDTEYFLLLTKNIQTLTARLDAKAAGPLLLRAATLMASMVEKHQSLVQDGAPTRDPLPELSAVMKSLAAKMDADSAAILAGRMLLVLENESTPHWDRLSFFSEALLILAARLDTTAAPSIAERVTMGLEKDAGPFQMRFFDIVDTLNALVDRLDDKTASGLLLRGAEQVVKELVEKAGGTDHEDILSLVPKLNLLLSHLDTTTSAKLLLKGTEPLMKWVRAELEVKDRERFSHLTEALSTLSAWSAKLEISAVKSMAGQLVVKLENEKETDLEFLYQLTGATSDLLSKMSPQEAFSLRSRSMLACAKKAQSAKPNQQMMAQAVLANGLVGISPFQSGQKEACLWVLSSVFLGGVQGFETGDEPTPVEPEQRRKVRELCESLPVETLVDVLKWPFCGGEAQKVVVCALEKVLSKDHPGTHFNGNIWKFIDQAPALGITNLHTPPRRPSLEKAIAELEASIAAAK
jgi:hypothetical protein